MVRVWGPTGVLDSDTHLRSQGELGRARILHECVVCSNKPINGQELQKEFWQSDQLIVVMKRGNACGAKGLARGLWKSGHFFRT
jgi:hypothetical protein